MNKGLYIVIEGPQGAGKTTQADLLAKRFSDMGLPVRQFREPDSQSDLTARAIRQLTQDPNYPMNTRTEVLLYNAARSQSLEVIRQARDNGVMCIVDRNFLTTLAIQYYGRGDVPDYNTINSIIAFAVGDMEPDVTVVLDAPAKVLAERSRTRDTGERFDSLGVEFLERVRQGYVQEATLRGYPIVSAIDPPATIHENLWNIISDPSARTSLPPTAAQLSAPGPGSAQATNPAYVVKDKLGNYTVTPEGREVLAQTVTSVDGNVYAFTEHLSPVTVAAAMARLSRRGDDMRITVLDEFVGQAGRDDKLLKRIITAYGDDSVQQLAGLHFVVENASNLLTKKLEWGRLAAYLEQSTRYIYFDKKDASGNYRYHTPTNLSPELTTRYRAAMDAMFDLYSEVVRSLTAYIESTSTTPKEERDIAWKGAVRAQACDAARSLLPVAVRSTVGIFASGQALESLIMHLLADDLPEARATGQALLDEARKVVGTFLERADKPDRGGATIAYNANTRRAVKTIADELLPITHATVTSPVQLTDVWPRSELDLVPDMLYEHSDLSLAELRQLVTTWSYDQKLAVFTAYMGERLNRRHRPGRALEKAHYSWDLVCDYGIFRDLQRHRMVDDMEWQALTPRYGFDMPSLVEDAGMVEQFEKCFDISFELYSTLQAAGHTLEAQYATLLGHKLRWKFTYNAREAMHFNELRTSPQGHPGYRKLVQQMHEKLSEAHPLLGEAMKFVNQGEDAELTRLAAERYTQFKLEQLDQTEQATAQAAQQRTTATPANKKAKK